MLIAWFLVLLPIFAFSAYLSVKLFDEDRKFSDICMLVACACGAWLGIVSSIYIGFILIGIEWFLTMKYRRRY